MDKDEFNPMPCLMTRMAGKRDKNLTDQEIKRANKLRKRLRERALAEGHTIIEIDAFTWMIKH